MDHESFNSRPLTRRKETEKEEEEEEEEEKEEEEEERVDVLDGLRTREGSKKQ